MADSWVNGSSDADAPPATPVSTPGGVTSPTDRDASEAAGRGDAGDRTAQTAAASPMAPSRPRRRRSLAPELGPGTSVGRYIVLATLGQGGMGVVYEAHDPELNRHVALKLIDKRSEGGRDRLLREAQALAKLSHPNVVAIHDVGTFEQTVFLAMELVQGRTLRAWIRETRPSWRQIRDVLVAAGRGLAAAHRAGLVHRDVKPDNLMVADDDRVRVLDFGLARAARGTAGESSAGDSVDSDQGLDGPEGEASGVHSLSSSVSHSRLDAPLTQIGTIMGTPSYMAPEQHVGGAVDELTDQFNFCATAYEAFFGQKPFPGPTLDDLREQTRTIGPAPPPASSRVPRRLRRAVLRGLSADKAARFPSMDALLAELAYDPRVVRRRAGAALGVAVLAGVVALAVPRGSEPAPRCRAGQGRLAGVWDPGRRAAVEQTFLASGRPYAAQSFAAVARRLDAYAGRWALTYDQACEATHVRGEQSEHLLDLRMRCLERRRDKLGAFTRLLAERHDPGTVDRAVRAAGELDSLDACSDAEALAAAVPLPADAATRAAIEALDRDLDANDVLRAAGDIGTAAKAAPALVERARALGHPPTLAMAIYQHAVMQQANGEYPAAEETYYAALTSAAEARDDRLAALVWIDLLHVVGYDEGRHDEAFRLARPARAALLRAGHADDLEAEYSYRMGVLYDITGKPGEARPLLERALELRTARLGPDSPQVGRLQATIALIMARQGDFQGAHERFLAALGSLERALGSEHPDVALVLSNIGYNLSNHGRYEEAIGYFRRSLAIMELVYRPDHTKVALPLSNLGSAALGLGRHAEACEYFTRALAIEERELGPEHPDLSYGLTGLGECHLGQGHASQAVAYLERALKLRERNQVLADERGLTRFTLARALWDSDGDRERARRLARQAREDFAAAPGAPPDALAKVDAWLAGHGGR